MWGSETKINLVSQRKSPTKYVYQRPVNRVGYVNDSPIERFLNDLKIHKQVMIVDTKNVNFDNIDNEEGKNG